MIYIHIYIWVFLIFFNFLFFFKKNNKFIKKRKRKNSGAVRWWIGYGGGQPNWVRNHALSRAKESDMCTLRFSRLFACALVLSLSLSPLIGIACFLHPQPSIHPNYCSNHTQLHNHCKCLRPRKKKSLTCNYCDMVTNLTRWYQAGIESRVETGAHTVQSSGAVRISAQECIEGMVCTLEGTHLRELSTQ